MLFRSVSQSRYAHTDEKGLNVVKVIVKQYSAKFVIGDYSLELSLADLRGDKDE